MLLGLTVAVLLFSVTGMSPLSPYLNLDPRYLIHVSRKCFFMIYFKLSNDWSVAYVL